MSGVCQRKVAVDLTLYDQMSAVYTLGFPPVGNDDDAQHISTLTQVQ